MEALDIELGAIYEQFKIVLILTIRDTWGFIINFELWTIIKYLINYLVWENYGILEQVYE